MLSYHSVHVEWITFFIVSKKKKTDTTSLVCLLTSLLLDNIHALCFFGLFNSCTLINR